MAEPISIILFKGPKCAICKPVERHLKRIVETSQGGASLKTIDTDEHADIALKRYYVSQVPHVLYNDEVILTATQAASMFSTFGGGEDSSLFSADQYDLFNYLFNKLIEAGVKASEADQDRWRKLSIISVSERLLNVDALDTIIRPSIGDYVHIGHLQAIVASLISINPIAKGYLFRAGELAGKFGAAQSWLHTYNRNIMDEHRMKKRFNEMLKGFKILYGPNPMALNVASDLSIERLSDYHAKLHVTGSAHAVENSDIGQDVCGFLAGEIAGLIEVTLGEKAAVTETKCWGLGEQSCEFDIVLGETSDHYALSNLESKKFFNETDRLRFELSIADISRNMYQSLLNKKWMRPAIGDFIHISVLQHILTSLKFSDPFNSTLLSYAGQHYGQILEDVGSISRIINRRGLSAKLLGAMEFDQACEVLGYYFNSPPNLASKIHADVIVDMIDDESARFKVYESAATSGINLSTVDLSALFPGVEEPPKVSLLDDFLSGYINGRLDLLIEEDVIVREEVCQANGHTCCEFIAELD
ncbi:MAG: V4R domain-containing protein [Candidatus Hodarchaeales archaeon]|jgi:predicted hydrocarbon binding protein/glutaredoxin